VNTRAMSQWEGRRVRLGSLLTAAAMSACAGQAPPVPDPADLRVAPMTRSEQILLGRHLVLSRGCGDCHGGGTDPAAEGWLAGRPDADAAYQVGEYRIWARNLTPDPETGLGRYSERQVFNALRYGLRPLDTPDVEITSTAPGIGNHPERPSYLAPAMPWSAWRYMSDAELWAVIAYLRDGLAPVRQVIPDGEAPPDRWASWSSEERIGPYPLRDFPAAAEALHAPTRRAQVLRGRTLVASLACGECHGGRSDVGEDGWLTGISSTVPRTDPGPFEIEFPIGPFSTRPRNLTPDDRTGMGRFSERQIFNALRYGLRPGETADVPITSAVPGEGNHPLNPKYLAPPMPWPAFRHLTDEEIRAVAAYLKQGLAPVPNRVLDSEGPPDFWVGAYTAEAIGRYPAPAFPTSRERGP
jgi:mono/diheme cytochrome c family protein